MPLESGARLGHYEVIAAGARAVFPRCSRDSKELFYDGAGDLWPQR